jgi:hypothetical protein
VRPFSKQLELAHEVVSLADPGADIPPPRSTGCIDRHRDSKGNRDDGETSSDFESQGSTGCIQSDRMGLGGLASPS